MVAYGATKAFDMVMAEALWAELHDQGVDVLGLVLGVTDTPALRRLLARRGNLASPDATTPIPGAAPPRRSSAEAHRQPGQRPDVVRRRAAPRGRQGTSGAMPRNEAVEMMLERRWGHGAPIAEVSA